MKKVLLEFLSPVAYMVSFLRVKQKATPLASPSTRFKQASRHLYNQLTELLIENCPLVALDLGGSLIKMTVYIPDAYKTRINLAQRWRQFYMPCMSFHHENVRGTFMFFRFSNSQFDDVIDFINDNGFPYDQKRTLRCTGGGAYRLKVSLMGRTKFSHVEVHDEIASLRSGMLFLTALKIKDELGQHEEEEQPLDDESQPYEHVTFFPSEPVPPPIHKRSFPRNWVYPHLLVQIGSGISYVRIDAEEYQRLDGSALGGATFTGLASMLSKKQLYKDQMEAAERGDPTRNTLSVGDIYGRNYSNMLQDLPAAFFGKQTSQSQCDVLATLNQMLCVNIAHIAVLIARQNGLSRIVFSGGFISPAAEKELVFGVGFYSNKTVEPIFVRHDAVLGAIGAMLGNEVQFAEVQDKIGKKIERIVQKLEEVTESEVTRPDVTFDE